ncbi:hypothetical protein HYDPIDRAFT_187562, partial [Hydnomerulius pinastri MD-312]
MAPTPPFCLFLKLLRWLTRILGTVFFRSYGAWHRVISVCLRLCGLRVSRSQAKARYREETEAWTYASSIPAVQPGSSLHVQLPQTTSMASGTSSTIAHAPGPVANYVTPAILGSPVDPANDPALQTGTNSSQQASAQQLQLHRARAQSRSRRRRNSSPTRPLSPTPSSVPSVPLGMKRAAVKVMRIRPVTADVIMERRYSTKGEADWAMQYKDSDVVPPVERDFSEPCPDGWIRQVQAEGAPYYYHAEQRLFTDAELSGPNGSKDSEKITSVARNLRKKLVEQFSVQLTPNIELVVDFDRTTKEALYYFVDYTRRVMFWVHDFDHKRLFGNIKGVKKMSHIKYAVETQYCDTGPTSRIRTHCELYPHGRTIPIEALKVLRGTLIHANAEAITSDTSLAPFDIEELGRMLDLVDKMQEGAEEENPDVLCVIARLMRMFSHAKFVNFYGQVGARLNADQSVYAKTLEDEGSLGIILLNLTDIMLFGAASAHSAALKGIWVDHTVNFPRWKGFINKLLAEWNGFTIYSTVMLAVDVSFLAIPALADTSTDTSQEPAAIISIYMSLLCVVGSLIISVLLVGQIRGQEGESAKGAADFMRRMTQSMLGLEALAIMQSIPYALLIWGMLFFVLALSFVIFGSHKATTIALVSPGWVIITILSTWPLWGSQHYRSKSEFIYHTWLRALVPMVSLSTTRALVLKLLGWLSRCLKALSRPNEVVRRVFFVFLRLWRGLAKQANLAASVPGSIPYCASSAPGSTGPGGAFAPANVTYPPPPASNPPSSMNNSASRGQSTLAVIAAPSCMAATPQSATSNPPHGPQSAPLNVPLAVPSGGRVSTTSLRRPQSPGASSGLVLRPGAPEEIMDQSKVTGTQDHVIWSPGDMDYEDPGIPGWVRCTQPEGAAYFFNPTKRVLTEGIEASKLPKFVEIADSLLRQAKDLNMPSHSDVELVVAPIDNSSGVRDCIIYYFVDHQQQLLFWVHKYKLSNIFANVQGVEKKSHMKHAVTTQYWTHIELYPNNRILKAEHHKELKGVLIHASAEMITSNTSLAPFDSDELGKMLDLVDKLEGNIGQDEVHAMTVVARLMRLFSMYRRAPLSLPMDSSMIMLGHSKFINFYGQPGARLDSDQSVYTKLRGHETTSNLLWVADIFLFGS